MTYIDQYSLFLPNHILSATTLNQMASNWAATLSGDATALATNKALATKPGLHYIQTYTFENSHEFCIVDSLFEDYSQTFSAFAVSVDSIEFSFVTDPFTNRLNMQFGFTRVTTDIWQGDASPKQSYAKSFLVDRNWYEFQTLANSDTFKNNLFFEPQMLIGMNTSGNPLQVTDFTNPMIGRPVGTVCWTEPFSWTANAIRFFINSGENNYLKYLSVSVFGVRTFSHN